MYHCEATTVAGFIQQLAVAYVRNGYWFYVQGSIPERKDPKKTDEKLIRRYEIGLPRTTGFRRKKMGVANVQYLRYEHSFILMATKGEHRFFEEESEIQDIRRNPVKCFGYSIGYRKGRDAKFHASVRIEERIWKSYKKELIGHLWRRPSDDIGARLRQLPFEPYAPVYNQILTAYRAINRKRKVAGLEEVDFSYLRTRRRPIKPFAAWQ